MPYKVTTYLNIITAPSLGLVPLLNNIFNTREAALEYIGNKVSEILQKKIDILSLSSETVNSCKVSVNLNRTSFLIDTPIGMSQKYTIEPI